MTEDEWNETNPKQSEAYLKAWENKQIRETRNQAQLELVIANFSGNVKKGVTLKIEDFLPEWAKPKKRKTSPEESEAKLKAFFISQSKKSNG